MVSDKNIESGSIQDWYIHDSCAWCPVCNEPIPVDDETIREAMNAALAHQCSGTWMGWQK